MRQARGEQCDLGDVVAQVDLKLHAEFLGKRAEPVGLSRRRESGMRPREIRSGEKDAGFQISVFGPTGECCRRCEK